MERWKTFKVSGTAEGAGTLPILILALFFLAGSLWAGLIPLGDQSRVIPGVAAACLFSALVPVPPVLALNGFAVGAVLESARRSINERRSETRLTGSITVKGVVQSVDPGFHGHVRVVLELSELLGPFSMPLRYRCAVDAWPSDELVRGMSIIARLKVKGFSSLRGRPVLSGSMEPGGFVLLKSGDISFTEARARLHRFLDSVGNEGGAGMLGAVALGERWRVDTRTRKRLQETGTYHLLAVSGVHVAAAALPVLFLLRVLTCLYPTIQPKLLRGAGLILSSLCFASYLTVTGSSSSGSRAALFFLATAAAGLLGRDPYFFSVLSWCLVGIVALSSAPQPDFSLLLSALAVTGIASSRRRGDPFMKGFLRMTLGAVWFTMPLAVWVSRGIPVVAPVANMVTGIPFALVFIPVGVLLDLTAHLPGFPVELIAGLWIRGVDLILGVLGILCRLPWSFMVLTGFGCLAAVGASVAGAFVWRRKGYGLMWGCCLLLVAACVGEGADFIGNRLSRNTLVVVFPRAGQADGAIVLYQGSTILIDCGPPGTAGRDGPVHTALRKLGVERIDSVFLSHDHPDHTGGLEGILETWPVGQVLAGPGENGSPWASAMIAGKNPSTRVRNLQEGEVVRVGKLTFTVLGPGKGCYRETDANGNSLILSMAVDGFTGLFTGDARWDQVQAALEHKPLPVLLKAPHHGSRTAFSPEGMSERIQPACGRGLEVVVFTSPPPGRRPLPAPEVVQWFRSRGIRLEFTGDKPVVIRYKRGVRNSPGPGVVDIHHGI